MSYNDIKEFLKDISKDNYMKWVIRILGTAIAIFIIIEMAVFRMNANDGKHVKIPFFEEGSDTVVKIKPVIQFKNKIDTFYKIKYVKSLPPVNNTSINNPNKVEIGTVH